MKTNRMNKILSVLLSLMMLVSVIPSTAFADPANVPNPERMFIVEADYTQVFESDIVTVYIKLRSDVDTKIYGAEWRLTYEDNKFDFLESESTPLRYYSVATGELPISADNVLGTYKFKAKAHEEVVTGEFNLTDVKALTRIEAADTDITPPTPDVTPEDVTINLRTNLAVDIKVNGSSVGTETEKNVVYTDAGYKVDIIPQLVNQLGAEPTDADVLETYVDGQPADLADYTFTDAKPYQITYIVKKTGYEKVDGTFTLNVTEADLAVTASFNGETAANGGSKEIKYNENGYKFTVSSVPDAEIKIGVDTSEGGAEAVRPNNELVIKDLGVHNFTYTVTKTNYKTETGTFKVTITEADFTEVKATFNNIEAADGEQGEITYDGAPHEFKVTSTPDATVEITVDGDTQVTDTVSLTDAKTYNISYVVSRPSYTTVRGTYTVVIKKADFTAVNAEFDGNAAPDGGSTAITYDTAAHTFKVLSTVPEGAAVKIKVGNNPEQTANETSVTDAGTYVITYTVSKDNYNDFTGEYTVTVNPAPIAFEAKLGTEDVANGDVIDVTYNAENYVLTITPTNPTDAVVAATVSIDGGAAAAVAPAELKFNNVGTYVVSYTISKANYATKTGSITINVKAPEYAVEVDLGENTDYVSGKKLVLVYVNSDKVSFTYGDGADKLTMYEVTSKGYTYDNTEEAFTQTPDTKVFAVVVNPISSGDFSRYKSMVNIVYSPVGADYVINTPEPIYNLNGSADGLDIGDVVAAYGTYHGESAYFPNLMKVVLRADIDGDKFVNEEDTDACAGAYSGVNTPNNNGQ